MEQRPQSVFTYPQLVNDQLQKADTGDGSDPISVEYGNYFALIKQYCYDISKIIETAVNGVFVPYYASKTEYFSQLHSDERLQRFNDVWRLELPEDLLSLDSITWMGTAVSSSYYRLVDDYGSPNGYPYRMIEIDPNGVQSPTRAFSSKVAIAGEWGIHDSVNDSYSSAITTTTGALTSSATTINLTNGDGDLFEIYQYIRIDDELMLITDIDSSGDPDVLTVERGANGFTASMHDSGASITRWNVVHDVRLLATKMVSYWWHHRNDRGERAQVINDSLIIAQFSKELTEVAERRQRSLSGVV